jgi:hypothetical protein
MEKEKKDKRIKMVLFRCPVCDSLTMLSLQEIISDVELGCPSCETIMVQV